MKSTFLFEAVEAGIPFILVRGGKGPARMPISNGDIALIEVGMVRQVVGGEIVVSIFGIPAENGVDLILIALLDNAVEVAAVLGLLAT